MVLTKKLELMLMETTVLPIPEMANLNGQTSLLSTNGQLVYSDFFREKLIILTEGFNRKIEIEFEKPIHSFTKWNNLGGGKFFVISGNSEYYYQLKMNRFFFLKYPGYLLIYLISAAFIWLLQAARMIQLREK